MKFGQSLAVSFAALLCTSSLALAQAPDKGGMGGGSQAPAERMEKGQPGGGGGARNAPENRQPSRGMSQSEQRGGADKGMHAPAQERSSNRSARPEGGKDRSAEQGRKDRSAQEGRERNQDKAERAGRGKDQDKAQRTARDKEQSKTRDRDQERAAQSRQRDQDKAQRTDRDRNEGRDRDQGKAAQGRTPDGNGRLQSANRVQASEKQHADVRQHLLRDRKVERSRINVAVNIGARVPRSVRLHPLSTAIIGFAPVYRGYSYVVLEDETICIVDPRTYVVVDVIPASTQRAEAPGRGHLTLSSDERRFVLTSIDKGHSADVNVRLALGAEIPRAVEVVTFPDRVIERVPQLRAYRYVVAQDQVVIVDPSDRQVALLIGD
jgi:hypothetical protein